MNFSVTKIVHDFCNRIAKIQEYNSVLSKEPVNGNFVYI